MHDYAEILREPHHGYQFGVMRAMWYAEDRERWRQNDLKRDHIREENTPDGIEDYPTIKRLIEDFDAEKYEEWKIICRERAVVSAKAREIELNKIKALLGIDSHEYDYVYHWLTVVLEGAILDLDIKIYPMTPQVENEPERRREFYESAKRILEENRVAYEINVREYLSDENITRYTSRQSQARLPSPENIDATIKYLLQAYDSNVEQLLPDWYKEERDRSIL